MVSKSLTVHQVFIAPQLFHTVFVCFFKAKGAVWTSGHRIEKNGLEEWRWLGSLYAIPFTKWFPGMLKFSIMLNIKQVSSRKFLSMKLPVDSI